MPAATVRPTTDRELAARAASGERAAFEELHHRHHARMRRVAMGVLGDPYEAEDAVQEAWIRAGTRIGGCHEPLPWLVTVTRNEALRMLARRRRAPLPVEGVPERADPRADPAAGAERAETGRIVRAAIAALPDPYRRAVALELGDRRPAEVAAALGIEPGAARVRLHRARRMLAERLLAAGVGPRTLRTTG